MNVCTDGGARCQRRTLVLDLFPRGEYEPGLRGEVAELAEGAPLLREYTGKTGIEGSNPSLSASFAQYKASQPFRPQPVESIPAGAFSCAGSLCRFDPDFMLFGLHVAADESTRRPAP